MKEIRSILDRSSIFDRWQKLVGAEAAKQWFVDTYVLPRTPIRVMEVGCGTGALCRYLPSTVQYVGVDIDEGYVAAARRRFPDRVFEHADVGDPITFETFSGGFDLVIAFGVLHHLDDDQVRRCLEGCVGMLGNAGTFLSVDPCHRQHERPLEYLMKQFDRGRFIRPASSYGDLVAKSFQSVAVDIEVKQMLMQYSLAVVTGCS
jgi:SAM-dependent methyltransferase